jgi:hypothetical protein
VTAPGFQQAREIGPLAELGDLEVDRADPGVPLPLSVAAAFTGPEATCLTVVVSTAVLIATGVKATDAAALPGASDQDFGDRPLEAEMGVGGDQADATQAAADELASST